MDEKRSDARRAMSQANAQHNVRKQRFVRARETKREGSAAKYKASNKAAKRPPAAAQQTPSSSPPSSSGAPPTALTTTTTTTNIGTKQIAAPPLASPPAKKQEDIVSDQGGVQVEVDDESTKEAKAEQANLRPQAAEQKKAGQKPNISFAEAMQRALAKSTREQADPMPDDPTKAGASRGSGQGKAEAVGKPLSLGLR